jgi:excinuclease ABC subunit C
METPEAPETPKKPKSQGSVEPAGSTGSTESAMEDFDGKAFCKTLTSRPGVYRMLDDRAVVLYVGKARNLKKRVTTYFQGAERLDAKGRAMVAQVNAIEIAVTHTEGEALILESNLIKEHKPRYNVVLRDDKSYPYIYLSNDQEFPRLSFHRGARSGVGKYFGPYPSAGSVRESLNLLEKLFQLRSCEDSYFKNRSRPCLNFQIKRCTAPCVGFIDKESYREDVGHAVMFLEGRSQDAITALGQRMDNKAKDLEYEAAARYRDQIHSLQRVQQRQHVSSGDDDIDVIACCERNGIGCVQVFYIRHGQNLGNKSFFPKNTAGHEAAEILAAFISQYYLAGRTDRTVPPEIIISHPLDEQEPLADALTEHGGTRTVLRCKVRGERARWLKMAADNADLALKQRLVERSGQQQRNDALQEALGFDERVERIECFDISHTAGEATVASCVVFGPEGPIKSDYRRFNIRDIEPGDDYAAMRQVIERRYTRVRREDGRLPDLLLIDGGKGQVNIVRETLAEMQLTDLPIVGVAKGPSRRPGAETLVLEDGKTTRQLKADSPALHLIQHVRDEAHRFAITGHRQRRAKARTASPLDDIPGIGAQRRRNLMRHFGGLQGVSRAGVDDLNKVPGISRGLAKKIYDVLHE